MPSLFDLIGTAEKEGHNFFLEQGSLVPNGDICKHCNGHGSSLKDATEVDRCSVCGGSGLINQSLFPKGLDFNAPVSEGLSLK